MHRLTLVALIGGLVFAACVDVALGQDRPEVPNTAERGTGLSVDEVNEGWISLFDGETLLGWQAESDANWRVDDGCIAVEQGTTPGLLRTTTQFDEYVLQLEFRADTEANSGVFVRTSPRPSDPKSQCFEINIAPISNPFPTGSIVERVKTAEAITGDDWHRMSITVSDRQVVVRIDDREAAAAKDSPPFGRGFVGLQFNSGAARFRNIRLKPAGLKPIFNGRNLQNWKAYDLMPGRFSVNAEGTLLARGGPGQLESNDQYADFALQFKCRTNAEELNSGIFVRCIPGEKMNGYEVQVDNSMVDGDRTKPKNAGTGAIMHRTVANRVVASDREWCAVTLIAVGPHFSAWVNGCQVTDWKDDRAKHSNPRNGLRLERGTMMLQAHDETTDILFADIFVAELNRREKGDAAPVNDK